MINTHQRPKVEEYDDHLFLVARMLRSDGTIETEQVAFFLGENYLITFQEKPGDCFEPIRERICQGKGRIRRAGADYLCYGLIDAIVDGEIFRPWSGMGRRWRTWKTQSLEHRTRAMSASFMT